jgi:hypothetical protein
MPDDEQQSSGAALDVSAGRARQALRPGAPCGSPWDVVGMHTRPRGFPEASDRISRHRWAYWVPWGEPDPDAAEWVVTVARCAVPRPPAPGTTGPPGPKTYKSRWMASRSRPPASIRWDCNVKHQPQQDNTVKSVKSVKSCGVQILHPCSWRRPAGAARRSARCSRKRCPSQPRPMQQCRRASAAGSSARQAAAGAGAWAAACSAR